MDLLPDDMFFEIAQNADDQTRMHISSLNHRILNRLLKIREATQKSVYETRDRWTGLTKSEFIVQEHKLYTVGNWAVIRAIYHKDHLFYPYYARLTQAVIDNKDYAFAKELIQTHHSSTADYWVNFIYQQLGSEIIEWAAPLIKVQWSYTTYTLSEMIMRNDRDVLEKYMTFFRPTIHTINSMIKAGMIDLAKRSWSYYNDQFNNDPLLSYDIAFPLAVIEKGTFEDFLWFYNNSTTMMAPSIIEEAVRNLQIGTLDFLVTNGRRDGRIDSKSVIVTICHYISKYPEAKGIKEVFMWLCRKGLQLEDELDDKLKF